MQGILENVKNVAEGIEENMLPTYLSAQKQTTTKILFYFHLFFDVANHVGCGYGQNSSLGAIEGHAYD
jgi:hypothetical protein